MSRWSSNASGPSSVASSSGIADADAAGPFRHPLEQLVVDRPMCEHPAAGDAGLPRGGEDPGHHTHRGVRDVGVLEHDVRRFAAELEGAPDEPAGR